MKTDKPELKIDRAAIGRRIKESLKGHDTAKIALKLGVARSTIYDWMQGRFLPEVERLALLAALTGTSASWIIQNRGPKRSDELLPEGFVLVSAVETAAEPGQPRRHIEGVSFLALNSEWTRTLPGSPDRDGLLLTQAAGDAMMPTIFPGDLLLANIKDGRRQMRDGMYLMLDLNSDQPTCFARRVLARSGGGFRVVCDNRDRYPAEEPVPAAKTGIFFFRVIWFGRSLP